MGALFGRRWAFLILGGGLLMPYWIAGSLVSSWLGRDTALGPPLGGDLVLFLCLLPFVAVTALVLPRVRGLSAAAAKELLGVPLPEPSAEAARDWATRWRTAAWAVAHLGVGGVMSGLSLALPPLGVVLLMAPFLGERLRFLLPEPIPLAGWRVVVTPVMGLAVFAGLILLVALTGRLLAWLAPVALGPSTVERVERLQRETERLAQRNRLARELHDSVGHALSVVTVQADAAARVLDTDPDFARGALTAIGETARSALDDLDHVLGLLRDEAAAAAPQPTLADLHALLDRTGLPVDAQVEGPLDRVPAAVSREAYRIIQEGLSNALRHAGTVPVTVRVRVEDRRLRVDVTNPLGYAHTTANGGRGLVGMRERVTVLKGELAAGPHADEWRVSASLPLAGSS
jgi:signal transduction histidine kinase